MCPHIVALPASKICWRSPKYVVQNNGNKSTFTAIYNARAPSLFYSLHLYFGGRLVSVPSWFAWTTFGNVLSFKAIFKQTAQAWQKFIRVNWFRERIKTLIVSCFSELSSVVDNPTFPFSWGDHLTECKNKHWTVRLETCSFLTFVLSSLASSSRLE